MAQKLLGALRELMMALSPEQRQAANSFWRDVRTALNEQDSEVQRLQAIVAAVSQGGPAAARPATSDSVNAVRDAIQQVITTEAQQAEEASATIEEICDLPMEWAHNFLQRQQNVVIGQAAGLGCWESGNVSGHETGYVKINMRNTVKPTGPQGQKFRCQPWIHQLGIVASGQGHLLRLTTNGEYHVSFAHLLLKP